MFILCEDVSELFPAQRVIGCEFTLKQSGEEGHSRQLLGNPLPHILLEPVGTNGRLTVTHGGLRNV